MLSSFRTGSAVVVAAAVSAGLVHAQTVDDIVVQNLKAHGGVEKLRALNSTKITGDIEQQGNKIHQVIWAKRPNLMRSELDATPPPPAANRASVPPVSGPIKVVIAFDGNAVWTINPMMGDGPQQITGPQADMAKGQADFDSVLLDYKAKGHTVEFQGTQAIDGKPTYDLKITRKNGLIEHYYLDVATGLEVRTVATVDQGGIRTEVMTDLSNYQTIDGLTVPFTMRKSVNGTTIAQITIVKWEMNVPLDDDVFKMPGK